MSKKSQFTSATGNGYTAGNFLMDSLSVAVADNRSLSAMTQQRIADMSEHVQEDPFGSNAKRFGEYVAKITPAASAEKPAVAHRATTKPGSGMM